MMFSLDEEPEAERIMQEEENISMEALEREPSPMMGHISRNISRRYENKTEDGGDLAKSLFAGLYSKAHAGVRHRRIR